MNRKFKLTIAYDGTNYFGFQIQKNQRTVEKELLGASKKLFHGPFDLIGASRTDTGVHALSQVVSVEVDTILKQNVILRAMNAYLPEDIVIQKVEEVDLTFHPRYDATSKTYIYQIYNAEVPLPQNNRHAHYYHKPLNIEWMKDACEYFIGEHDYIAFSSAGGSVKTTTRTIKSIDISQDHGFIRIEVTGNGFLYHMMRKMVGNLIEVGNGALKPISMRIILESKNRSMCKKMAPACGLTLANIEYPPIE